METIYSLATARGKAGIAVVRVSGDLAFKSVLSLTGKPIELGRPSLRYLHDPQGGLIDQSLILTFAEGASFTGEKTVEFQLHGSPAIVSAVLALLETLEGFRIADPGEFTRRALLNGQLKLEQVEGLADLLEAETEAQRIQAIRVFDGRLGKLTKSWRADLVRAAALLEATIDFADEDVPVDVSPEVIELVEEVWDSLRSQDEGSDAAERIRDGFEVAIIGSPNIGKSTLLNSLAGRDVALTSRIAGTTRDVVEVKLDLNGLPVTILDTAGIRHTTDEVEAMGVDLALRRAEVADVRVFVSSSEQEPWPIAQQPGDIQVIGKSDNGKRDQFGVSGLTGHGVTRLMDTIGTELSTRASGGSVLIRERHRVAIRDAMTSLNGARARLRDQSMDTEIIAEEIRMSIRSLDPLIGNVDVENVLDEVFSSFCLGK